MSFSKVLSLVLLVVLAIDDAEMFTSEMHDPYARTTGA